MKDGWRNFSLKEWLKNIFGPVDVPPIGTKVFHPIYGYGVIHQTRGARVTRRVTVDFGYARTAMPLTELILHKDPSRQDKPQAPGVHDLAETTQFTSNDQTHPIEPAQVDLQQSQHTTTDYQASSETEVSQPTSRTEPEKALNQHVSVDEISPLPDAHSKDPAYHEEIEEEELPDDVSVEPLSDQAPQTNAIVVPPASVIDARKALMALRLGQALESKVLELSVGTAELESELRKAVSEAIDG
ncbi:MAG: hypothetical protein PHS86_12685, partial [Syntrophaceae bacterium]|nr:hypothetical protein [Syntrophaceae bacterium]